MVIRHSFNVPSAQEAVSHVPSVRRRSRHDPVGDHRAKEKVDGNFD
jgi:hypothetical protein